MQYPTDPTDAAHRGFDTGKNTQDVMMPLQYGTKGNTSVMNNGETCETTETVLTTSDINK
jgi:hypothetical protein